MNHQEYTITEFSDTAVLLSSDLKRCVATKIALAEHQTPGTEIYISLSASDMLTDHGRILGYVFLSRHVFLLLPCRYLIRVEPILKGRDSFHIVMFSFE